jgi:hypothetical protein
MQFSSQVVFYSLHMHAKQSTVDKKTIGEVKEKLRRGLKVFLGRGQVQP